MSGCSNKVYRFFRTRVIPQEGSIRLHFYLTICQGHPIPISFRNILFFLAYCMHTFSVGPHNEEQSMKVISQELVHEPEPKNDSRYHLC